MSFVAVISMKAAKAPLVQQVTPQWLVQLAGACEDQLRSDVAPVYGGTYSVDPADPTNGVQVVVALVDDLPDAPGDVAYPDWEGPARGEFRPLAFVPLSQCSTLDDLSQAVSYELVAAAGDLPCNRWADDGHGLLHAIETVDAVESNGYRRRALLVSDFVLPEFWADGFAGPLTWMQRMGLEGTIAGFPSAPFVTAEGGYQLTKGADGQVTLAGSLRAHRVAHKQHWSSRAFRRGARLRLVEPREAGDVDGAPVRCPLCGAQCASRDELVTVHRCTPQSIDPIDPYADLRRRLESHAHNVRPLATPSSDPGYTPAGRSRGG